jgi:hypothetical protein
MASDGFVVHPSLAPQQWGAAGGTTWAGFERFQSVQAILDRNKCVGAVSAV